TGHQIGVAVVADTGTSSLEDYANDLFDEWGIGDAGEDDGVLVLVALGGDRGVRIEVGGGLEGELTDVESGDIIRDVLLPRLRDGDVDGALTAGIPTIRRALGDTAGPAPPEPIAPEDGGGSAFAALFPLL